MRRSSAASVNLQRNPNPSPNPTLRRSSAASMNSRRSTRPARPGGPNFQRMSITSTVMVAEAPRGARRATNRVPSSSRRALCSCAGGEGRARAGKVRGRVGQGGNVQARRARAALGKSWTGGANLLFLAHLPFPLACPRRVVRYLGVHGHVEVGYEPAGVVGPDPGVAPGHALPPLLEVQRVGAPVHRPV